MSILYLALPLPFSATPGWLIGGFFLSAALVAAFAYFVNDTGDVETDRISGKKNMAAGFGPVVRGMIILVLGSSGMAVFWFTVQQPIAMLLLGMQLLLLLIYALRPFRFKNHPLLGPLFDAHYGHVVPVGIAIFAFLRLSSEQAVLYLPLLYGWLLCKGLRNILLHQLDDRKKDKAAGIQTFPNRYGPLAAIRFINRVLLPAELVLLLLNLAWLWPLSRLLAIGLGGFILFYFFNFSGWRLFTIPYRQLLFKFLYVLNDFYEGWLPYLCIWSCRLRTEEKLLLTGIHALVFHHSLVKTWKDLRKIAMNLHLIRTA